MGSTCGGNQYASRKLEVLAGRTASHADAVLSFTVVQLGQEWRDGALGHFRKDQVSERFGRVGREREVGREADQELLEERRDACAVRILSAESLTRSVHAYQGRYTTEAGQVCQQSFLACI